MVDLFFGVASHRLSLVLCLVQSLKNTVNVDVRVPTMALLDPIHNLANAGELFLLHGHVNIL